MWETANLADPNVLERKAETRTTECSIPHYEEEEKRNMFSKLGVQLSQESWKVRLAKRAS
jgi:hypothetical protein